MVSMPLKFVATKNQAFYNPQFKFCEINLQVYYSKIFNLMQSSTPRSTGTLNLKHIQQGTGGWVLKLPSMTELLEHITVFFDCCIRVIILIKAHLHL